MSVPFASSAKIFVFREGINCLSIAVTKSSVKVAIPHSLGGYELKNKIVFSPFSFMGILGFFGL